MLYRPSMCEPPEAQRASRYPRRLVIETRYDPPPIPTNNFDWCAITENYEPGQPMGHGPTEADAVMDLYIQLADADEGYVS